jgi:hypothetical protein
VGEDADRPIIYMEALFRHLVVGVVPQPRQVPPAPFRNEDLQRVFTEVGRDYPYQQFSFLPGEGGAQLANSPEDVVLIQPGLLQVRTPVMTPEQARQKVVTIMEAVAKRLELREFLACGIKVVSHVPAPGGQPDAKAFVTQQLMKPGEQAEDLGPGFFGGGIKYRRFDEAEGLMEEVLLIEPFVGDNAYLFIDYDVQRRAPFRGLDELSGWIDDAFEFVRGPTMTILGGVTP